MPTNYTPVPSNAPATNTFPSDLDDADAESVGLAFRAAADNLMGLAAIKANTNVFTENLQEISNNAASTPAIVVNKDAGDDSVGANIWKNILEFKVASENGRLRLYTGRRTAPQQVALTLNAAWDVTNQRWFADDTARDSVGLLYDQTSGVFVARRAAAVGTWTDWTALTLGDIKAYQDLNAGRDVNSARDMRAQQNILSGGDYLYIASQARSNIIPLQWATASGAAEIRAAGGAWELPPNTRIEVPISLPNGATIDSCFFGVEAAGASADWQGDIFKQSNNLGTGGIGGLTSIAGGGSTGTVTSGSEPDLVPLSGGSEVVNNSTTTYHVSIGCGGGSASNLYVGSVRILWHDPGPKNY